MRKYLFYLLFFLLLSNSALSKISLDQQRSLINSNEININLNCSNLFNKMGGFQGTITYSIGDARREDHSYILLHTHIKEENNIYYLCKQNRYDYASSESIDDQLKDQDLHKIFYDSYEMVKYVLTVADEDFTKYMMSKFYLPDYKLEREQLVIAYAEALAERISKQNQMSDEEKKALEEKEKREKIREEKERKEAEEKRLAKLKIEEELATQTVIKTSGTTDTTPPDIKIASTITVHEKHYSLQGEVTDKGSKKIYIRVKDEYGENPIKVINGKFTIKRFSPEDEEIQIIATDTSGNEAMKTVKVKLEIKLDKKTVVVDKLNPSSIKNRKSPNRVALIIGIENYLSPTPKATFANSDALWFYEYAQSAFGISEDNIKLLVDEKASFIQTQKNLSMWLPGKIKANQTELIIFFSGHGLSTPDGKELYLLLYDSVADLLPVTAISRSKLIKQIDDLKPKSVTLFLDACYTGSPREDESESLYALAKPIKILSTEVTERPDNFTIFSASGLNQISSGFKAAKHGLFSYYLMKGLEGYADNNKDKKITNKELLVYLDENISQISAGMNRPQNPELAGNTMQVLMKY